MSDEITAPWLQLTLEAVTHSTECLEDALLEAGAVAVTLQDAGSQAILEPLLGETPLWPHTRVTGLFSAQTDIQALKQTLSRILDPGVLTECCMQALEERDWVRAWLEDFHPMRFGRRLWVCPSEQSPPEPTAVNLFLDPGLAFGSGTHPTTALCLNWLDQAILANKTIIDYGCGSGILAIAAAKLGASRIWAVDIDPQALLATPRNAAGNGVQKQLQVLAPESLPTLQADIVLANILAGTLIGLAPRFATLVAAEGKLVLSGILDYQVDAVEAAFVPWFQFDRCQQREDWVLLQATRTME